MSASPRTSARPPARQAYPLARAVLAADIEGAKRKRILAVIAAYHDEGREPSVREVASRAKVRNIPTALALIRLLEADGLLRVEWAQPPSRNVYEILLTTGPHSRSNR